MQWTLQLIKICTCISHVVHHAGVQCGDVPVEAGLIPNRWKYNTNVWQNVLDLHTACALFDKGLIIQYAQGEEIQEQCSVLLQAYALENAMKSKYKEQLEMKDQEIAELKAQLEKQGVSLLLGMVLAIREWIAASYVLHVSTGRGCGDTLLHGENEWLHVWTGSSCYYLCCIDLQPLF